MHSMIDRCLLTLLGCLGLLASEVSSAFVIAFFTAVTFSGFCYTLEGRAGIGRLLPLIYAALSLRVPQFCFFLPLLCYDLSWELSGRARLFGAGNGISALTLIAAIAGLIRWFPGQPPFFPLLLGVTAALLLRHRTDAFEQLCRQYQRTRDDDTERRLLLEETNRSLLEKQDAEIYSATLRERNRIAREIHDNVGHMLTRSILMVGALKAVNRAPELGEPLQQLGETLDQAMDSIRRSVHDLHDRSINLEDSLRALIRDFTFCPVTLRCEMSPEVPREVKYCFLSIAREAFVNISRHSNATAASLLAIEHPGFYQFILEDNGSARTEDTVSSGQTVFPEGIGLSNIQSRVRALNGNLQIRQEHGFRIYITIPKEDHKKE